MGSVGRRRRVCRELMKTYEVIIVGTHASGVKFEMQAVVGANNPNEAQAAAAQKFSNVLADAQSWEIKRLAVQVLP